MTSSGFLRGARIDPQAITGREKILKFEGGFHGSHELVQISVGPPLDQAGAAESPRSLPDSAGIPEEWLGEVVVMPFNDAGAVVGSFGKGDVKVQNAQCLICHEKNQNLTFWNNSKVNRLSR